ASGPVAAGGKGDHTRARAGGRPGGGGSPAPLTRSSYAAGAHILTRAAGWTRDGHTGARPPDGGGRAAGGSAPTGPSPVRQLLVAQVGHEHVAGRVGEHQLDLRRHRDRLGGDAAGPEDRYLPRLDRHGVGVVGGGQVGDAERGGGGN